MLYTGNRETHHARIGRDPLRGCPCPSPCTRARHFVRSALHFAIRDRPSPAVPVRSTDITARNLTRDSNMISGDFPMHLAALAINDTEKQYRQPPVWPIDRRLCLPSLSVCFVRFHPPWPKYRVWRCLSSRYRHISLPTKSLLFILLATRFARLFCHV